MPQSINNYSGNYPVCPRTDIIIRRSRQWNGEISMLLLMNGCAIRYITPLNTPLFTGTGSATTISTQKKSGNMRICSVFLLFQEKPYGSISLLFLLNLNFCPLTGATCFRYRRQAGQV